MTAGGTDEDSGSDVSAGERRDSDETTGTTGLTPAIRPLDRDVPPEEPPGERLEYTTDRRSLAARVQVHWAIRAGIGALVGGVVLTAVLSRFGLDPLFGPVVVGVLLALTMTWVVLRYRRWVYQIRGDALYLERGVLTHTRTLVPYVRIQHVDTSQGPLERSLGLSTLVVYTAGSRGADVSIPGLTPEQARDLQQRVKDLAIEAEGGDAL